MFFAGYLDDANESRAAKRGQEIGKKELDRIAGACEQELMRTDCYVHGDCHAFNLLVEGNRSAFEDDKSNGDVAIIDWEMAHCGPIGKDLGWAQCFPVACLFAHAINDDRPSSKSIMDWLD